MDAGNGHFRVGIEVLAALDGAGDGCRSDADAHEDDERLGDGRQLVPGDL